mmetsp:Transcript_27353/g.61176  ORF Transcript_27353/g.61176 Transcript_27353/m.61176 type:complete len:212 (-) Transcript_27353:76-711(-)
MRCRARRALDWIWIGPPYGAYAEACSNTATCIPLASHAAAVTRPASPPPATSTRSGSSWVTWRGLGGGEKYHSEESAESIPCAARASSAACCARPRTLATRSTDSRTRFGAAGCARTALTWSGMFTLLEGGASPSASQGMSTRIFRRIVAGPMEVALFFSVVDRSSSAIRSFDPVARRPARALLDARGWKAKADSESAARRSTTVRRDAMG